jgi:hypothetical protein
MGMGGSGSASPVVGESKGFAARFGKFTSRDRN